MDSGFAASRRPGMTARGLAPTPLPPRPIIDGVLVRRAGRHQAPAERPVVVVFEALARIWGRRSVEDARQLEILYPDHAAGFLDDVMRELLRVLLDRFGGARLGAE